MSRSWKKHFRKRETDEKLTELASRINTEASADGNEEQSDTRDKKKARRVA
jgi:hypothetical protein